MTQKYLFLLLVICSIDSIVSKRNSLIELDESNWTEMLTNEWMVAFKANWCGACRNLMPTWEEFAKTSGDFSVKVAVVEVTKNPGLSGRFMITALPTIYHVKDGVFRQYTGNRDRESLWKFVDEKKWKSIEPLSKWTNPASVQMATISLFFKVSMAIREIHTRLVEDYGIPYWGSYILFALSTILIGVFLSLIIVFVLDFVFPPKVDNMQRYQKLKTNEEEPEDSNRRTLRSSSKKEETDDELAKDPPVAEEAKKEL